tara:strand:+ start:26577 stop:26963 length:387 start_codon:yes stop_codon:yes gene_type:complete
MKGKNMTNIQKQLDIGVNNLIDYCIEDYRNWSTANNTKELSDYCVKEIDRGLGLKAVKGSKYIKIIRALSNGMQESVWGFIVASEKDKKFQVGDILMAAGWRGPARNKARGNVLTGNFGSRWTGPNYL